MSQNVGLKASIEHIFDFVIIAASIIVILSWIIGKPLFYSESWPTMSIFTAISLMFMSASRLAEFYLFTWARSMSMAMIGIVIGGNLSSISVQVLVPKLFVVAIPDIVPTSIMTSVGLMIFCFYQVLVLVRPTEQKMFIFDDILLHLALAPGGVSLLGHVFSNQTYLSSSVDPRVGISLLEMAFMGTFAVSCFLYNKNLFMWKFLKTSLWNRLVFAGLFLNQYILPVVIGLAFYGRVTSGIGVEFFVFIAGTFATLVFLSIQAAVN